MPVRGPLMSSVVSDVASCLGEHHMAFAQDSRESYCAKFLADSVLLFLVAQVNVALLQCYFGSLV